MLVSSRSYDEYVAMFGLSAEDLSRRVLDCSAGAASFVTVAASRGCRSVAVDPAYAVSREELADAVRADLDRGTAIAHEYPDRFVWDWYGSVQERERMRKAAAAQFLAGVAAPRGRYVAAELPRLPFKDGTFDLALCSHLLFTWADVLGLEWHLAAVSELARVAREVRIFPTVMQGAGEPVPFWDELLVALAGRRLRTQERRVDYRFQRTANRMLVVTAG